MGRCWKAIAAGVLGVALSARAGDRQAPCELPRADRAAAASATCLACHDGSAARGLGESHPVEVDYPAAFARDPDRYAPAASLPPEVLLVGGRVTCTSCHDGASPHRARAVEPARLCQACHRL